MPSQAAQLAAQGQAFHASQFPACITLNGQAYDGTDCARNALRTEKDLLNGGYLKKASITFWLAKSAVERAGARDPRERDPVIWEEMSLTVAQAVLDATGATWLLRCTTPEQ